MPKEPLLFLKMDFIDKVVAFCVSIWTGQSLPKKSLHNQTLSISCCKKKKLFPSVKYKFRNWVQLLREFMAVVEEQKESSSCPQPKVSSLVSSQICFWVSVVVNWVCDCSIIMICSLKGWDHQRMKTKPMWETLRALFSFFVFPPFLLLSFGYLFFHFPSFNFTKTWLDRWNVGWLLITIKVWNFWNVGSEQKF